MSMNIFRLAGDMSHVFSIILLLLRLQVAKNANGEYISGLTRECSDRNRDGINVRAMCFTGVSLKTQELFLIVFCTRYLDLFTRFISMYNSVMKVLYIGTTGAIIHLIRYKVRERIPRERTD